MHTHFDHKRDHTAVLIGGGFSNTIALKQTVERLVSSRVPLDNVKIKVYDIRKENFGGGVAYSASDPAFEMNGTVRQDVLAHYRDWLAEHRERWQRWYERNGGEAAQRWLEENKGTLESPHFREKTSQIFFPRALLGLYLKDLMHEALHLASQHGIEVQLIEGSVQDINRGNDGRLHCELNPLSLRRVEMHGDGMGGYRFDTHPEPPSAHIAADTVLLAPGMPSGPHFPEAEKSPHYFRSPYDNVTGQQPQMERLRQQVDHLYKRNGRPVEIALAGSGASAHDVLHNIARDSSLTGKVHVTCISKNPKFYEPWDDPELADKPYQAKYLTHENVSNVKTQQEMFALIEKEVEAAKEAKVSLSNVLRCIKACKRDMRGNVPSGVIEYTNRIPATNPQVAMSVRKLRAAGVASLQEGDIASIRALDGNNLAIETKRGATIMTADIAINCMGPARDITMTSSPLLQRLMAKDMLEPNHTKRGVKTLQDRQSPGANGLFVIGPLLTDNLYTDPHDLRKRYHGNGNINYCYYDAEEAGVSIAKRILAGIGAQHHVLQTATRDRWQTIR